MLDSNFNIYIHLTPVQRAKWSLLAWNELLSRIDDIQLTQEDNAFHRNLTQSRQFSMKSHYQALIKNEVPNFNKIL